MCLVRAVRLDMAPRAMARTVLSVGSVSLAQPESSWIAGAETVAALAKRVATACRQMCRAAQAVPPRTAPAELRLFFRPVTPVAAVARSRKPLVSAQAPARVALVAWLVLWGLPDLAGPVAMALAAVVAVA